MAQPSVRKAPELPDKRVFRTEDKPEDGESPGDVLSQEMQKCLNVIKTMKAACAKQKNISLDIKNGIAALEESLDKMKWHEKGRGTTQRSLFTQKSAVTKTVPQRQGDDKPGSSKRPPSSPLIKGTEKRTRSSPKAPVHQQNGQERETPIPTANCEQESYAQALKKKKEKKTKKAEAQSERRSRPDAILIKPRGTEKYTDILREIRSKANPDDTETIVKTVRQTKTGDVLLELGSKTKNKTAFGESLKEILGEKATVRSLEPKIALEIRDLDELTTPEEVQEAVRKKVADFISDVQVSLTGKNRRSLKMAIVHMNARAAREMLKYPKIKIGWVQCRVRRRIEVSRCYKCFGYGHQQGTCSGIDRKGQGLCFNCGEKGHKRIDCQSPPKCCLCANLQVPPPALDHVPGSGKCQVFREALENKKKKASK